jgi:hypothetical protein
MYVNRIGAHLNHVTNILFTGLKEAPKSRNLESKILN